MKKICLILAMVLGLFCVRAQAQAVEDARRSVVHLYGIGYDDNGDVITRWTGTGFAVGIAGEDSDVFLTNWHVATGSGTYPQVRLWLLRDNTRINGDKTPDDAVECQVLATTDGFPDVAVLQTLSPVSGYPALPLRSSRQVLDGTPVYALGFPGLAATHYGMDSGPEDVVITPGAVHQHLRMKKAGNTMALIHSAPIRHGNSGGPLVTEKGIVVGQNTYGFEVTSEFFCAVYLDYAMALLDELEIPYTTAVGPSRLTVWVANTLHRPNISDGAAAAVFVLGLIGCLAFLICYVRTMNQLWKDWRNRHHRNN